jgi:hypothetical protein
MKREAPKVKVFVASNDQEGADEYEGSLSFTDGMHEADERIFQVVALTENGQVTVDIPVEAVFAEMRRTLRGE